MFKTKVNLNLHNFGKPLCWRYHIGWYWKFYSPQRRKKNALTEPAHAINVRMDEGETDLITIKDSWAPVLIAVTPKQYKGWAKQKITYKHNWFIVNWILQLKNLIRK